MAIILQWVINRSETLIFYCTEQPPLLSSVYNSKADFFLIDYYLHLNT